MMTAGERFGEGSGHSAEDEKKPIRLTVGKRYLFGGLGGSVWSATVLEEATDHVRLKHDGGTFSWMSRKELLVIEELVSPPQQSLVRDALTRAYDRWNRTGGMSPCLTRDDAEMFQEALKLVSP